MAAMCGEMCEWGVWGVRRCDGLNSENGAFRECGVVIDGVAGMAGWSTR
ncbi:hypothetical protein HMPREF9709_00061 [Helcococcus kunzii ATCC 51366]|uniref:Uncharacterized protein n=1 Tax=Helcococcus kunzii ATCC 51366 TaxID=883114 RepID=H3NL50_9FIRM|nr:hypothetical protein HMPREF9709_00061 [Helcococcus kunzii ATCC 51366]